VAMGAGMFRPCCHAGQGRPLRRDVNRKAVISGMARGNLENFKGKSHKLTAEDQAKGGSIGKRGPGMKQLVEYFAGEQALKDGKTIPRHEIVRSVLLNILGDKNSKNYNAALAAYMKILDYENNGAAAENRVKLENQKLKQEIELLKAKVEQVKASTETIESGDDGFLAALDDKAAEVWKQ